MKQVNIQKSKEEVKDQLRALNRSIPICASDFNFEVD